MQHQDIFSFFGVHSIPQELHIKMQTVLVENVDYHQKAQRLDVFVTADHIIDSPSLTEAEELIADQAFPSQDIRVLIIPRFLLKPSPSALEIMNQYKNNIAWELEHKKRDVPMRMLYMESNIEEISKGIILRTKNKFMAELTGQKLVEFLKEILQLRFGVETGVLLEVCEDPELTQAQLQKQEQERVRVLAEHRTSNQPKPKAAAQNTSSEKPVSLLLYGKNTDGIVTRMDNLDDMEGNVVVRGRILSSEVRNTKREDKKLLILSLTDDTDSITAKLFVNAEIADKLFPQLQEGTCIKVKGIVSFDSYSKEQSISTVWGISKIEEFKPAREDTAAQKTCRAALPHEVQ